MDALNTRTPESGLAGINSFQGFLHRGQKLLTIEKAFKLDIDFDVFGSIAHRWGLQDKSIQKIQFYAGVGNKPYVLLFCFSDPTIEGLWGYCMNGFKDWQGGWSELREACLRENSQNMRNWRIFAHDESENQYLTSEYLLRNE